MARIYEQAAEAIAWLPDKDCEAALHNHFAFLRGGQPATPGLCGKVNHTYEEVLGYYNNLLLCLSRSSCWRRLWVQQELCLADKVITVAGNISIDRGSLISDPRLEGLWENIILPHQLQCIHTRLCWAYDDISLRRSSYLHDAILHHYKKECADPRDKIFGIMALVREDDRIEVDYTMTASQVSRTASCKVLSLGPSHQDLKFPYEWEETASFEDIANVWVNLAKAMESHARRELVTIRNIVRTLRKEYHDQQGIFLIESSIQRNGSQGWTVSVQ